MPTAPNYHPKRQITIIESARGFAALYIVQAHVISFSGVYDNLAENSWLSIFLNLFFHYGHQVVLLFFLLSGFSIHYSSVDRNLTTSESLKHYYYLRWRRIYPIFILAVVVTIALDFAGATMGSAFHASNEASFNIKQLLYTLTFLTDLPYIHGVMQSVMMGDSPLWSLSYEVVYYLIYPVFWMINLRFGLRGSLIFAVVLSTCSFVTGKFLLAQHFLNVLDLYIIWCLGAVLADMHRRNLYCKIPMFLHATIIYVLLQSCWVLGNATYTVGAFAQISWGVMFFFIMLLYLNKLTVHDMQYWHRGLALLVALCGYLVIIAVVMKLKFVPNIALFYGQVTLTLLMFAIGLFWPHVDIQSICNALLKFFYRFGKSSYGIYVIHFPLLLMMIFILRSLDIPALFVAFFVPAILYIAWFIELRYQPYVLRLLDPLAVKIGIMQPVRN